MKKIVFFMVLVFLVNILGAEEPSSIKKKILIFNLFNKSKEKGKTDYLSKILSQSLYNELKNTKKYEIEIVDEIKGKDFLKSEDLKEYTGDFFIVGDYNQEKNRFLVSYDVFISGINKTQSVTVERKRIGAVINDFLDEISLKVTRELDNYYKNQVHKPKLLPLLKEHYFYKKIEISSKTAGAEIWYTTNGKKPLPGKSKKYKKPFSLEESSKIRTIAYYSNWEPSMETERYFTIHYPVNDVTFGINYGLIKLKGDSKNTYKDNGGYYNFNTYWEIVNIPVIKKIPLIRDIAITADMDAFGLDFRDDIGTPGSISIYAPNGGLMYKLRLLDFINFDFGYAFGRNFTKISYASSNQIKTVFNPPKKDDDYSGKYWKVYGRINFIYKSFGLSFAYSYHRALNSEDEESDGIKMNTYSIGLSYRL